jgi:hypothetical protein
MYNFAVVYNNLTFMKRSVKIDQVIEKIKRDAALDPINKCLNDFIRFQETT